ncbi:MAG: hypothetical protein GF334_04715 [Candidatus Altiarchaeales archaeon]|nr:hypothetical protein [Candidatus Altiarchaeales archaeon]
MPRTLVVQNQVRSTTSGIEYDDTLDLGFAENIVNDAFLNDPTQVSGTLVMDLNYLRTALRDIKGESPDFNWFDPTASTPGLITLSGARGSLDNLHSFVGSSGDLDVFPIYSSTVFVTQNGSLEQAVGELDSALSTVSGSQAGEIAKVKLIRTGGNFGADTAVDLSSPGAGWTVSGDTIVWTDATDFVENVSVFVNGILQLPGADSSADNDVYFVGTPDQLAFEFNIKKNDVIQVWKFPPT